MRLGNMFIVNCNLDFICFVNSDLEIFIPAIRAGWMRAGTLSTFNLEGDIGFDNLLGRGTYPAGRNDGRMIQFAGTLDGDKELSRKWLSAYVLLALAP